MAAGGCSIFFRVAMATLPHPTARLDCIIEKVNRARQLHRFEKRKSQLLHSCGGLDRQLEMNEAEVFLLKSEQQKEKRNRPV